MSRIGSWWYHGPLFLNWDRGSFSSTPTRLKAEFRSPYQSSCYPPVRLSYWLHPAAFDYLIEDSDSLPWPMHYYAWPGWAPHGGTKFTRTYAAYLCFTAPRVLPMNYTDEVIVGPFAWHTSSNLETSYLTFCTIQSKLTSTSILEYSELVTDRCCKRIDAAIPPGTDIVTGPPRTSLEYHFYCWCLQPLNFLRQWKEVRLVATKRSPR